MSSANESPAPMTLEEWAALDEEIPGELVDGILVEEEMPSFVHEVTITWWSTVLSIWMRPRRGFVVGSGVKYGVGPGRGRIPDGAAFFPGSRPQPYGLVSVPPDVALEVITPTARDVRRDRMEKTEDYATFGVRFYWIIDPERRMLEIFELGPDRRYVLALAASEGRVERVPGCEGLSLDLSELWSEVERAEIFERGGTPTH